MTGEVVRHDDAGAVAADVATRLLEELARVQAEGREPQVGLTGGTIADAIHREVARLSADSPAYRRARQLYARAKGAA